MRIRLDSPMLLGQIVRATSGISEINDLSQRITHITTRSTLVEKGDLYVPLKGKRFNGADFLNEAISKGAVCISEVAGNHGIIVKNQNKALLDIAKEYKVGLKKLKYTVTVTGSVGKSTTKEFIKAICFDHLITHATDSNLNNTVGVPITVLKARAETELLVIEAGMNQQGELADISYSVHPDIAIITNIGTAHIGSFGSREGIAAAKREILLGMSAGRVIVPYGEPLLEDVPKRITVSLDDNNADVFVKPISIEPFGTKGRLYLNGKEKYEFYLSIPGRHILECLAFAIAACVTVGIGDEGIINGISSLSYKNVRQRYIHFKNFSVYDDSYNSSPEALKAAFTMMDLYKDIPKSALLGDMLELGRDTERFHYEAGALAAKHGMKHLYLFGVYSPFMLNGALSSGMKRSNIFINTDTTAPENTAKQILENHIKGELVLFKASNALNLYRIFEHIKLLEG